MKDSQHLQVKLDDLKIGMYVILPLSWHQHPFLKNHFIIQSEEEIQKIRELGLKAVQMDVEKSHIVETSAQEQLSKPQGKKVETTDLITTIHDRSLQPESKSKMVKQHSIDMMKGLLENPSTQNIKESRKSFS
jgi:hypothetical protein